MKKFYYNDNKLKQLEGFCATVKYGTIKKAAEINNKTISNISLQISALEKDIGYKLLKKQGNKLIVTEYGLQFYSKASYILNELKKLYEMENNYNSLDKKIFKIASHYSIMKHYIPKISKEILIIYPKSEFEIYNISRNETIEKILKHEIDFAIFPYEESDLANNSELELIKVLDYKPGFIVNKNNPLAKKNPDKIVWSDITNMNVLHLGDFAISKTQRLMIDAGHVKSNIKFINCNWDILEKFVEEDIGISAMNININNQLNTENKTILPSLLNIKINYYLIILKSNKSKIEIQNIITKIL